MLEYAYVFLILLGLCYSSNLYSSDYLLVDFNKVTDLNRTITVSESINFAPCPCDVKPFVCDMFCCCDNECSVDTINSWKSSPENICIDVSDKDFYSTINCQNEDEIFYYNSKYSIVDYKYPLKNMFCLFFDNSGYKGNFYKNVIDLDDAQLLSLYQSLSNKKNGLHYYLNFNTGVNLAIESERYLSGDYIRVKRDNKFQKEGKVMIQGSNMIGRCERMRPLKFMVDNAAESCGQKLKINRCASYNWKNQLLNELDFFTLPSISAPTIKIEINSIYLKDFVTGEIILNKDSSFTERIDLLLNTTLLAYDSSSKFTLLEQFNNLNFTASNNFDFKGKYCSCDYFLNEAHYSIVIDNKISTIQKILVDVFLYKSINTQCEDDISLKQQFSSKYTISPNEFFYSGAPGYNIGEKLLYARNYTNDTGTYLEIPSQGWILSGSYSDERCYLTNLNDTQIFSVGSGNITNKVVQFGVDLEYTCKMRFNLEGYKSFCDNNMFGGLDIFYQMRKIDYVGIFGKSSKNHLLDWKRVLSNYNTKSTWNNNTLSCEIPTDLTLLIVYSKAGGKNIPQNYIVSAVSNYTYQNISFINSENTHRSFISNRTQIDNPLLDNFVARNTSGFSNVTENIIKDYFKEVTFRLNVDFMELIESDFTATKKDFSFRKYFDFNLTNPFGN